MKVISEIKNLVRSELEHVGKNKTNNAWFKAICIDVFRDFGMTSYHICNELGLKNVKMNKPQNKYYQHLNNHIRSKIKKYLDNIKLEDVDLSEFKTRVVKYAVIGEGETFRKVSEEAKPYINETVAYSGIPYNNIIDGKGDNSTIFFRKALTLYLLGIYKGITKVGRLLGLDHSTVHTRIKTFKGEIEIYPDIREKWLKYKEHMDYIFYEKEKNIT